VTEEIHTDIDAWARAHGFDPSDAQLAGATPLLRLGEVGTTDDAYRGTIDEHDAWLGEFSIGSPNITSEFGGDGVSSEAFTVFLVGVDADRWPRLTVHPSRYPDHDLLRRLRRADHRVHTVSAEFDARYRVIASTAIPERRLAGLFTTDLIAWWLDQDPEISVDVELHKRKGGYLTVAHPGLGLDGAALDQLLAQTRRLLAAISPPDGDQA
jgi:hypothetical protein